MTQQVCEGWALGRGPIRFLARTSAAENRCLLFLLRRVWAGLKLDDAAAGGGIPKQPLGPHFQLVKSPRSKIQGRAEE